jgi:anti-sigma-K factor RskA
MNCQEFEELSGAYALGAISPAEKREADAHLQTCDLHPEVAEYAAVASTIAMAAPEMDPPASLKLRLMDAVRANAAPAWVAIEAPKPGLLDTIRSWFSSGRAGYALSGVMAVLVVGLVAWNVTLQSDSEPPDNEVAVQLHGDATGTVTYLKEQRLAVMDVSNLAPLPADQTYQVWAISDGEAASLGLLEADTSGHTTVMMPELDLEGVDSLAVTIEPAGGSTRPSSDPVATGEL